MSNTTRYLLNNYKWNSEELEVLNTIGYEGVNDKVVNLDDNIFNKVDELFEAWLFGECPKAKLNYWMKKANLTDAEWNIWKTA